MEIKEVVEFVVIFSLGVISLLIGTYMSLSMERLVRSGVRTVAKVVEIRGNDKFGICYPVLQYKVTDTLDVQVHWDSMRSSKYCKRHPKGSVIPIIFDKWRPYKFIPRRLDSVCYGYLLFYGLGLIILLASIFCLIFKLSI